MVHDAAYGEPVVRRTDLLRAYWDAQAQFGPFDVGPEEFVASFERKGNGLQVENPQIEGFAYEERGHIFYRLAPLAAELAKRVQE